MATTSKFPRHPDDWYVEPEWCAERLFQVEHFEGNTVDPACGEGRIVKAAQAAGLRAFGSDIVKRSDYCRHIHDFMLPQVPWYHGAGMDNVVSNPPFGLCNSHRPEENFAARCIERARTKCALLLPADWHCADKRSRWLESTPLRRIWVITPRPSMPPGDYEGPIGNGIKDYAWYVWLKGYDGLPETRWLRRNP